MTPRKCAAYIAVGVEPTLTTGHGSPAARSRSATPTAAARSASARERSAPATPQRGGAHNPGSSRASSARTATSDDLEALANAVREAARPRYAPGEPLSTELPVGSVEVARRGHLRMLAAVEDPTPSTPDDELFGLLDEFDD